MLKPKLKKMCPKKKAAAIKFFQKEDNIQGLHFLISKRLYKKLNLYLAERDISAVEWFREKIEEL